MSFNVNIWKVEEDNLLEIPKAKLDREDRLENWIARDPHLLDLDLLIIGRQVTTDYGGRIDLLGIDIEGNLVIIELKRDRTPREVVAQVLDYASWVKDLTPKSIDLIAQDYLGKSLDTAFSDTFRTSIPDALNTNHRLVIIASELDDSSERIVQYLAEEYSVDINVIFFNFHRMEQQELVSRAWLMNPEKILKQAKTRQEIPWSGYYYVNVGEGKHRNWDDERKFGFISAGQGAVYSNPLKRLEVDDKIFAYRSGKGYVGYGVITEEAKLVKEFKITQDGTEKLLLEQDLVQPNIKENSDDPELSEWIVRVNWFKSFSREEAKTFPGIFTNPNIVCKLRDQKTFEFLKKEFYVED